MSDTVKAPWTPEQVRQLWKWQTQYIVHPFTCGNRENHPEDLYFLIPTVRGWVCMFCDYTQDWCHAMMLLPADMQFTDSVEITPEMKERLAKALGK